VRHALVGRIVRAYEADTARRLAQKDGDTEGLARTLGVAPRG
jgi:phosphate starvation-inducible protein PhoH and related proteins